MTVTVLELKLNLILFIISVITINNGNSIEWSPIRAVIIRVNHEYDKSLQTELEDTMSCCHYYNSPQK